MNYSPGRYVTIIHRQFLRATATVCRPSCAAGRPDARAPAQAGACRGHREASINDPFGGHYSRFRACIAVQWAGSSVLCRHGSPGL